MALNFPASPTDGQIYEGYQWDASKGVWVSGRYSEYRPASTDIPGIVELATDAETQTGTDASKAVTPASLSSRTATTSRTGLVELATNAEVQDGSSTTLVVTPAGLAARTATTTRAGVVELATDAEAQAMSSTSLGVTPGNLGAHTGIPVAIATGTYSSTTDVATGTGVSIAVTFPSGRFSATPVVTLNPTISGRLQCAALSITSTGFTARLDNFSGGTATDQDFNWMAIQY